MENSKPADFMLLSYILIYFILMTVKLLPALRPQMHKTLNTVLKCLKYGKCYVSKLTPTDSLDIETCLYFNIYFNILLMVTCVHVTPEYLNVEGLFWSL